MSQTDWQTLYFLQSMFGGGVAAVLGLYCWRRRDVPSARPLMILAVSAAIWLIAYASEFRFDSLEARLWGVRFEYIGVVWMGPAFLSFALVVCGLGKKLNRKRVVLISLFPLLLLILVWTNPFHHLMWSRVWLESSLAVPNLCYERGPMFWALVIYTYLLLMTGSLVVTHSYWKARQLHRKQMAAVMVGVLPPWLANLFYVLELEIIHGLDPTPFAFTFSGLVFAWAIFRLRLLKLVPIARERVLDLMQDAVIVLDQEDRVVDLNPSGLHLALSYKGRIWGRRLADALPELAMEASQRKPGENQVEFTYGGLRPSRIYEVRNTPLFDQEEAYIGKVLILRDVTEHQRAEQALIQSEAKHRSILESIEEGFYEVDRHGRFTMVNRAMCDLMGQDRYKLLGNDIRDYMIKEQALAVTEAANQIYRSGHSMGSMEWLFSTPGGDLVQLESSVTLIKTKDGKISGFRGICRDVTTRKKAEEERILREKYQAAIETAGAACHELNQPLQSILILIELILTTLGPDTTLQPKFQQLVTESNRMAKITRRLINLTDYRTRNYVGDMKILELVDDPERN